MKILSRLLPALLILLTACAPQITHHPHPDLSLDTAPFEALGCTADSYGRWDCPSGTALDAFDCARLEQADALLGGLQPAFPLAACISIPQDGYGGDFPAPDQYFFNVGGMLPQFVRYVAFVSSALSPGDFYLLSNPADLRALYAPVESPEEALAFALALYPVEARYDLSVQPGLKYEVRALEDTHVETVDGGYLVHVFHYQLFGCGPHFTQSWLIQVSTDGQAEVLERQNLFRDPGEDGLCVD